MYFKLDGAPINASPPAILTTSWFSPSSLVWIFVISKTTFGWGLITGTKQPASRPNRWKGKPYSPGQRLGSAAREASTPLSSRRPARGPASAPLRLRLVPASSARRYLDPSLTFALGLGPALAPPSPPI
jgi:hypothetical protein